MKVILEMPHGDYEDSSESSGVDSIDFNVEKMPIDKQRKKGLSKAFRSGKGIIGKFKSDKYFLFTPDGIKPLRYNPKDKDRLLPPDWQKYAVILRDGFGNKNELKEFIRTIVRDLRGDN